MASRPGRRDGQSTLRVNATVHDLGNDDEAPELVAYTFSQSGRLLGRTALKAGAGDVPIPPTKEPENVRVVIGPPLDDSDERDILATLTRLEGPEQLVGPHQLKEPLHFAIDRSIWTCWFRFCVVRGTLLKRVTTGGLPVDLPSCGAEIEVYEVDPVVVILPKIPDYVLERIRDLIRQPWPPPPPPEERFHYGIQFPPVPPGPGPDLSRLLGPTVPPRQSLPSPTAAAFGGSLRRDVESIVADLHGTDLHRAGVGGANDPGGSEVIRTFNFRSGEQEVVEPEEALASVQAVHDVAEIRTAAHLSLNAFKASLIARPELVRPLLCWLWPIAVNMQLVATTTTDECGKFRTTFYRGCSSDVPDLYFKAFRRIGFFRIQVYGPTPIACHTWWDYPCGTEVTLTTTHPFALSCPPCKPVIAPQHWVLAMAVGNTSLAAINGTSAALAPTTDASNIGLTSGAPFGGYIRFRFEFDNTLRTDLNVRFYRVRWRKIGSGNPFVDLAEDVLRHYAHVVGTTLMIEPYKLGPQPVGATPNLYEIPPALPPFGQWSLPDVVVDTTSTAFNSAALAPHGGGEGDYEFELTLFDGAGNAVDATALGINYAVPTTLDLTSTIPTANAASLGLVTGAGRLVFQLHVDNNSCVGTLQPPEIAGTASADPCGLLRYQPGDSITHRWTASHPHQFATFQHGLVKGATQLPAPFTSAGVVTPAPGLHVETFAVSDLVGTCLIAGFAETVSVWAMATDGWSRQGQYDAHALQAFALAPQEP
jgi:hypothetical protein